MNKILSSILGYKEKFSHLPVKSKLMFIILSVTIICILMTVVAFSTSGIINIKKQMRDDLSITGTIVSNRINAALVFRNNSVALETLNALSANQAIQLACVYDTEGNIFAKYYSGTRSNTKCPAIKSPRIFFTSDRLQLYREINDTFDQSLIGILYIESDLSRVSSYMFKQTIIALIIMLIALIIGYILAKKLQNIISQPISMLVTQQGDVERYISQGSLYYTSPNELTKLEYLMNSMCKHMNFLEHEVVRRNKELNEVIKNSVSTFNYLTNEMKQPLESTLAFGDIISSRAIGDIDPEYVSYYNDVYLNVFYYYGIINDTMGFYKNHLRSVRDGVKEVSPNLLFGEAMSEIKTEKLDFLNDLNLDYNIYGCDREEILLDKIIVKEIMHNLVFIFSKYIKFLGKSDLTFKINLTINNDIEPKGLKVEITCADFLGQDIADILEKHREYQNDVHLLRAKLQYLKYLTTYNGGYLDYGDDLRRMSQVVMYFPLNIIDVNNDRSIFQELAKKKIA